VFFAASAVFADVTVHPDTSLPGTNQLQSLINGFSSWALMAALAGMLLGAGVWALGHHASNYQQSMNGRRGLLISGVAAIVVGAAPALVNFLFKLGTGF